MKFRAGGSIAASAVIILLLFALSLGGGRQFYDSAEVFGYENCRTRRTLVLDAGHGGADGGAVSITGRCESEINIEIVQKIADLSAFYGIDPVLTRKSEEIDYPDDAKTIKSKKVADQRARVALVNALDDPFFISIHQNKFSTSGARGAQVFYGSGDESKYFAEFAQGMLCKLDEGNSRPAEKIPPSVYLMKNITCPAVLFECGFLSNPTEAALLETQEYQLKLAALITGAYVSYTQ